MMGIFWVFLREEVKANKGSPDSHSYRDKKLIHRDPKLSDRYNTEFENLGGLNLWKHPFQYYAKARVRDTPQNAEFKKILERNISSRYIDDKNRDIIEVTQKGAEAALNNTVWLQYWFKKTGRKDFYIVIIPQHVYVHRMSKAMFAGWVKYNPKLIEVPSLMGSIELESIRWKQERLPKTIRDIFE